MTCYVFVGPTIALDQARSYLDACFLPPVARGDLYRVARKDARAIAIIDGYFEGMPSVWHKEILWAIDQGIPVLGAASMGALRAAELHSFGMQGVGLVFEWYRDGRLEDDDEVAVVHGPPELGFLALSDAMVDIRATLNRAEASGVIGMETNERLTDQAKSTFYKHRSYEQLLNAAAEMDLPAAELEALRVWLPSQRVLQKREDAIALLKRIPAVVAGDAKAKRDAFHFQTTENWAELVCEIESESGVTPSEADASIMEELRLQPATYVQARRGAVLRRLAMEHYQRVHGPAPAMSTRRTAKEFRLARGLLTQSELHNWLADHDLAPSSFEELLREEAAIDAIEQAMAASLDNRILDRLRVDGSYLQLARRARDKQRVLASCPDLGSSVEGADTIGLLAWYFEQRLDQPIPDDLEAFVSRLDFADTAGFIRSLQREYVYCTRSRRGGDSQPQS